MTRLSSLVLLIVLTITMLRATVSLSASASPDTFGKTTIGTSSLGFGADIISGSKFTLSETGTITRISKYIGSYAYGSGNSKCAIYADSSGTPGALKVESSELTSLTLNAWNDFAVSPGVGLAAGNYWILFWSQQNAEHRFDIGGPNVGLQSPRTYGAWPDPWTADLIYYTSIEFSIYATYVPGLVDTQAPTYSIIATNTTLAGQIAKFYALWSDNTGLSGFIFGTNNTGTWQNDTWTPWAEAPTSGWSNITKSLNSDPGIRIEYKFWVNDTSNNWADTGIHFIITRAPGTATIRGTVTDTSTGISIVGVNVTADGWSTLTASDGTYSLTVVLGSYNLTLTKWGYINETRTQDCPTEEDYVVDVSMKRQPATIRGTVTDFQTGGPIEGVNITVNGQSTLTALDGTYSLNVTAGSEAPDIRPYFDIIDFPNVFSLSNISASSTGNSITINWTTDLPATSKVEYNTSPLFNASLVYDSRVNFYYWDIDHVPGTVVEDATPVTNHSITLTGLLPGTLYYFRVQSQDPSGTATSKVYNIMTPLEGTTSIIDVSSNPAYKSEVRFTWVAPESLINPDWDLIAQTSKDYGIDVIIVKIMSTTFANYPSNYIPHQAVDQLAAAIAAAHAHGLQLHISMSVLIDAFKDEYKAIAADGTKRNWTDPTNLLARTHIKNLVEEVVSNYDIDGFMFDYVRYESADIPYGPYAKQRLEAYLGENITDWPGDFAPGGPRYNEFMEWRVHALDELVKDMREWMLAIKPNMTFSAAVWGWVPGWPTYNRYWIGQDFVAWVKEGYLDFVAPMMYDSRLDWIEDWVQDYLQYGIGGPEGKIPLVTFLTHTYPKVISPADFKLQVDTVRSLGADGWSTFRYGGPGDGERFYNLKFSKPGYFTETRSQSFPTAGEYFVNVSLKPITATISGTVTDSSIGFPIAGVNVTVDGQSTLTALNGTYSFTVTLGSYNLTFTKSGYYTNATTVDCPTEGTYTVNISLVPLPSQPPTNYELMIEDMDEGNKLYAMYKFYHFTAKAYDNNGDLSVIKIAFTDGVTWANFSFTVSDRTFTRLTGYLIAELNASGCSYQIDGRWVNATFSIRIKYGADDAPNIELYQQSEDSSGNTIGWQIMQTDYANIIKPNVSPPLEGITMSMAIVGSLSSVVAFWVLWKKQRKQENCDATE